MQKIPLLPRPRIGKIFDDFKNGKLIYVIAGGGFGKTQSVQAFLEKLPMAVVRWVQFSETDASTPYFWQRLLLSVSSDNSLLAAKLAEHEFPKTLSSFKLFAEILRTAEHKAEEIFLVLDDFHLVKDSHILTFAERIVHLKLPNLCVIFVSRQEPPINAVSLFAKGRAVRITEDDLRFTEEEIGDFLTLHEIPFKSADLCKYHIATAGWAMGVQFLSLSLRRFPQNPTYAIDIMKSNIDRLFETEAFENFPANVKKILAKLSLVSDIPFAPLHGITDVALFIEENYEIKSFVWYDSLSGDFRIHPLYLEFLGKKQTMLDDREKLDAYSQAAEWCKSNGYTLETMRFYAKAQKFGQMLQLFFSNPHKLPHDTCLYYLGVIGQMTGNPSDPNYVLIKAYFEPLMLIGIGEYEKARMLTENTIEYWEKCEHKKTHQEKTVNRLSSLVLYFSYSNLAYIDMFECTVSHVYDAPRYIRLSMMHLENANLPKSDKESPFLVPNIRSYACLVGEGATLSDFDRFYEATKEMVALIQDTSHDMYYGYDALVACELHYYKNELILAKKFAFLAISKARAKNQQSIEALTRKYLLRIAIHAGDAELAKDVIEQLRSMESPHFWNKNLITDLIMGSFYALIGCPKLSPGWLSMTKKEERNEIHIPIAELAVTVMNYIAAKKYERALTVLSNSYPRKPQDRFLFGELYFSLISSIAKVQTGDTGGGLRDFRRAYDLSFRGVFEMFFIEMGKNLHPVLTAALKDKSVGIDEGWLGKMMRKTSVFTKKSQVIATAVTGGKERNSIKLSEREVEVLSDMYQGLSRDEIAENRYLSVNTVKKIIQSIFIKLDANNTASAIRIAVKRKLLD